MVIDLDQREWSIIKISQWGKGKEGRKKRGRNYMSTSSVQISKPGFYQTFSLVNILVDHFKSARPNIQIVDIRSN